MKTTILQNKLVPILYLSILIIIKIIIQLTLYHQGFVSVSADEFSRGIRAAKWALNPRVDIISDFNEIWLPFEKYVNGIALRVIPDVYWTPRITVFIASCILLIAYFFFVYLIFADIRVSIVSAIWIIFQPWYAWLSATPMLEMYYLSLLFVGLVFIVAWLKTLKNTLLLGAGISFFLSSGFHVPSWVYLNGIILVTIFFFVKIWHTNKLKLAWFIGFLFLSNLFVMCFEIFEFFFKGQFLGFLQGHTIYSKIIYGGYNIPFLNKLIYYPKLVIDNISPFSWIFVIISFVLLMRGSKNNLRWFPFSLSIVALMINSVMNTVSVPATAAPGRYSLYFILHIAPYIAFGFIMPNIKPSRLTKFIKIIGTIIFLFSIIWDIEKLYNFPNGMTKEAIRTGKYIKVYLDKIQSDSKRYMVELKYWDFLGVELTAEYYNNRFYDREYDVYNRNTPSIFFEDKQIVCTFLRKHRIQIVALANNSLKEIAASLSCLKEKETIGDWTLYIMLMTSKLW